MRGRRGLGRPSWGLLWICAVLSVPARAAQDVTEVILTSDRAFWQAYNACDTAAMRRFFTADLEFYHDQSGPMMGPDAVIEATRANLCAGRTRVRREPVDGTIRVFPLRRGELVYGAILSGEHRFYVREGGGPETLSGVARFTHLWLVQDGTWRMARVLSYAHEAAPVRASRP